MDTSLEIRQTPAVREYSLLYQISWQDEFKKLSPEHQKRVMDAKGKDVRDFIVVEFIKRVIGIAEGTIEREPKKDNKK